MGTWPRRLSTNGYFAKFPSQWRLWSYHLDVFSRYLFAYPVNSITATAVSRVIMDILCKHTYVPTTIVTDIGTQFNAQVTHEIAAVLGIELKHATSKHAQTIGLFERTHASVKTHLKAATGEVRNKWHKYLPLAVQWNRSLTRMEIAQVKYLSKPVKTATKLGQIKRAAILPGINQGKEETETSKPNQYLKPKL